MKGQHRCFLLFSARFWILYHRSPESASAFWNSFLRSPFFLILPSPFPVFSPSQQCCQCLPSGWCLKVAVPRCLKLKFLGSRTLTVQHMFSQSMGRNSSFTANGRSSLICFMAPLDVWGDWRCQNISFLRLLLLWQLWFYGNFNHVCPIPSPLAFCKYSSSLSLES